MTYPRNEAQLVKRITDAVKAQYPDVWQLKTHGNPYQRAGVPDLLLSVRGRLLAVEVKHQKPGESRGRMLRRLSPRQRIELEALSASGAATLVAWDVDQVLDEIRKIIAED